MKKIILLCLLMATLTGCSLPQSIPAANDLMEAVRPSPVPSGPPLVETEQDRVRWGRSQLSPQVQEAYDSLYAAAAGHQETEVELSVTPEQVSQALTAIGMDCPELFWFDGEASYMTMTIPMVGERITCTLTYTMTRQEALDAQQEVDAYTAAVLSSPEVASAQSDYEKILGVYRYIIGHTDYVLSEPDQSFLSVMTRGQGTCAGYARCFQYLMHRMNIPCTMALGYGEGGESHGWNVVQCGGGWYHVDVTWGDPVDAAGNPGDALEYTYCMLTDDAIFRTHSLEPGVVLPECSDTTYHYYRQAGLWMESWNISVYESLLNQARARGDQWFTVQFAREEEYRLANEALITSAGIMDVFRNCGITVPPEGVTYSYNDDFYEFSVKIPA